MAYDADEDRLDLANRLLVHAGVLGERIAAAAVRGALHTDRSATLALLDDARTAALMIEAAVELSDNC